jgi:hypothetical protein
MPWFAEFCPFMLVLSFVARLWSPSEVVWRSYVSKHGEQIVMGSHSISRHPPICENSQEGIGGVIGESGHWSERMLGASDRGKISGSIVPATRFASSFVPDETTIWRR